MAIDPENPRLHADDGPSAGAKTDPARGRTPELVGRIDEACDRFEADWRAGRGPRIEDYLDGVSEDGRADLLRELLVLEVELRRRRGEMPDPRDYLARFADQATLIDSALALDASATLKGRPPAPAPPPPPADWPALPDFEILGELGRGGMGVVYRARQVRLNRACAVKMILAGNHASREEAMRFLSEAETVARLHHPSIVSVYSLGDFRGRPYVELEYVEGGSLADQLDGTPWPARDAARLVETLARAIHAAHEQGVVHRDLKPANVLLKEDGTPKITDFGLAKTLDSDSGLTRTGAVLGSPSYMAPEQAEGKTRESGPAADVYSLGAILYELMTGRPPFRAPTVLQTLEQVKSAEPVPPSRFQPGLPTDIETIALKCLRKEPPRRYESAAALAEDLRRFQAYEPILARRVGPLERGWRWCRRHPAEAALAAFVPSALLVLAIGALATSFRLGRSAERERLAAADARRRLVKLDLTQAEQSIVSGDLGAGLPWLLDAMTEDRDAERARQVHRPRLLSLLVRHPRLVRLGPLPALPPLVTTGPDVRLPLVTTSPDGRWLAALGTGEDRAARIWDVASGRLVGECRMDLRPRAVLFAPGGREVVTVSGTDEARGSRYEVRLWDVASARPLGAPIVQDRHVYGIAFSPDGQRLLLAVGEIQGDPARSRGEARVLDCRTGQQVGASFAQGGPCVAAAFHPDGRRAAVASLGRVRVWDVETGRPVGKPMVHPGFVDHVAFAPGGRALATACHGQWARVWNAETGAPLTPPLVHRGGLPWVSFSPDGRRVVTAGDDHTARVWDVHAAQPVTPVLAHRGPVLEARFSPDGRRVATASRDHTVRIWDAETGRAASAVLLHTGPVRHVGFDPLGRFVTTVCDDGTLRRFDLAAGLVTAPMTHGGPVRRAVFSPDGKRVATVSNDSTARVWDSATGDPVTPPLRHRGRWATSVAFSPDGRLVASSGLDATVRLWDATSGRPTLDPIVHPDRVASVAFSPDGRVLLTECNSEVFLWEVRTGRPAAKPLRRDAVVNHAEFRPDGRRVITAWEDGQILVWDYSNAAAAPGEAQRIEIGRDVEIDDVGYSRDGRRIIAAGKDRIARVWDAETGRLILPPLRHDDAVRVARFSPDGRQILTAGADGSAQVWDAGTGRPLTPPLYQQGTLQCAVFSPDGRRIAAGSTDGTIRVWAATTGQPVSPLFAHDGAVNSVEFSPDGLRVLSSGHDGLATIWELSRPSFQDERLDLTTMVRLLSGREVDERGDVAVLTKDTVVRLFESTRASHPEAFTTPPEEVFAWHRREAWDCLRRDRLEAALAHINVSLLDRPGSWHGHWLRSQVLEKLGRLDDAMAALDRAIAAGPADEPLVLHLRDLRARSGQGPNDK